MSGFAITIDGVDFTDAYVPGTLTGTDTTGGRGDATFVLRIDHGGDLASVIDLANLPGLELAIANENGKIFGGLVLEVAATVGAQLLAPFAEISLSATGFAAIADRRLVSAVFIEASAGSQTAGDIARELFDDYLAAEGVTVANIEAGPIVERLSASYATVAQLLDELVRLSGSTFTWRIDEERRFYFEARGSTVGPSITSSALGGTVKQMSAGHSAAGYRNTQIVEGGTGITEERTEDFKADGEAAGWAASLPIAELVGITVGGSPVDAGDIGLKEVDVAEWVWQVGREDFGVNTDPDLGYTVPANGTAIELTYRGYYPLATIRPDYGGIAARAAIEGGTGIYEAIESTKQTESVQEARDLARGLLERHRRFTQSVAFLTDSPGFRAGQVLAIVVPELGLSDLYAVVEVSWTDLGGELQEDVLEARVKCELSAGVPEWLEWLRKFFLGRDPFRVRENQVIDIPIAVAGAITVAGSIAITASDVIDDAADDTSSVLLVGPAAVLPREIFLAGGSFFAGPVIGWPRKHP